MSGTSSESDLEWVTREEYEQALRSSRRRENDILTELREIRQLLADVDDTQKSMYSYVSSLLDEKLRNMDELLDKKLKEAVEEKCKNQKDEGGKKGEPSSSNIHDF